MIGQHQNPHVELHLAQHNRRTQVENSFETPVQSTQVGQSVFQRHVRQRRHAEHEPEGQFTREEQAEVEVRTDSLSSLRVQLRPERENRQVLQRRDQQLRQQIEVRGDLVVNHVQHGAEHEQRNGHRETRDENVHPQRTLPRTDCKSPLVTLSSNHATFKIKLTYHRRLHVLFSQILCI